ncbi:hypothetical protein D8B26_005165 [Coccidioides posadasii str. Silveira]|uniref:Uncharacterized protein n=1 Tax=Coccidioides posadasii (strain RMSCC 757 / Silveira) TaxID=443226 RepID=E9D626_COCPS|nr:conserved hypothetical protein [Coccidioides posadasii str. Silveira]QVM10507.1 hypothetical protein D8B26_005165 [Coccidioides posadasii str. Silveira]
MSTSPDITDYVNRGPLTTTFTPPTTCFQTASRVVMILGTSTGTTTYYGHWFKGDTACYPTGTMPASLLQEPTFWGTYLYSPGLHCPRGWSTAGQITGSWQDLDVTGSTSGAICCPSALSYYAKNHQCRRVLSESATLTFSDAGVVKTTVLDTTLSVYADGIPLIWESSDRLSIAEPTPPHGATTQHTASQPISTTSDSSLPSRVGLSQGAKIGIGVGVSGSVILIAAVIFFLFLRRAYRKTMPMETPVPVPISQYKVHTELPLQERKAELSAINNSHHHTPYSRNKSPSELPSNSLNNSSSLSTE